MVPAPEEISARKAWMTFAGLFVVPRLLHVSQLLTFWLAAGIIEAQLGAFLGCPA